MKKTIKKRTKPLKKAAKRIKKPTKKLVRKTKKAIKKPTKKTIKKVKKSIKKRPKKNLKKKIKSVKKSKKIWEDHLNKMQKKIDQAVNRLKKDIEAKKPFEVIEKDNNELLFLLGECNYFVREFHSKNKK